MGIFDQLEADKHKKEIKQEAREQFQQYSTKALKEMHRYSSWRVYQLDINKAELKYLAHNDNCQLGELMRYARRIERTEENKKKFEKRKKQLEYEIMRRKFKDDQKS